jgi:outer membrane biosynthesis protein TonB
MSSGNTPFSNLSNAPSKRSPALFQNKKFKKEALRGSSSKTPSERYQEEQKASTPSVESEGSNQMLDQKAFSVEEVGALTLSTYKWKWAPYINAMKNKLNRVWFPPSAYYQLGLIHGHTIVKYTISRSGEILGLTVLDHQGHKSLEISSTKAIESLFPFLPLPDDFPDETLTIRAKLVYPDLRRRR